MKNIYETARSDSEFNLEAYEKQMISRIKEQVGSGKVLLALSGGVDSSVCAALLAKAIPSKLYCIYVDTGFMRKDESKKINAAMGKFNLNLVRVNAEDRFLARLRGVTEPEKKRMIIGEEFIRVFEEEAKKLKGIDFLAQGTIYTDVFESGVGDSKTIKSHHNVGGLPKNIAFKGLVEPLRVLYKSEVRALGEHLGLPPLLTKRQPFPGPGLAVRCIGEVTKERLDMLREADAIFCEEIEAAKVRADQYFAVLTDLCTVGIHDGDRAYGYTIALRAIATVNYMTAEYVPLEHSFLARVSERITTKVPAISRVVYDITNKPPSTIEWE